MIIAALKSSQDYGLAWIINFTYHQFDAVHFNNVGANFIFA